MKQKHSRRRQRVVLWLMLAAACTAAVLWHTTRGTAQQPQQEQDKDKRGVGVGLVGGNAQRKIALIMGNGDYQSVGRLKNPVNDAADMAEKLRQLGFELVESKAHTNLSQRDMKRLIRAFGNSLRGGDVGVFFFAGHGVQLKGKGNFLLPVDIAVENEADIEDLAVNANLVLDNMAYADNGLNIIILDACRNNPFDGRGMRSLDGGLARMDAPSGTLIAYAAAPGKTAGDNPAGRNGTYTTELLKKLGQPGLSTLDLFQEVGTAVYQASQKKQDPWIEGTPRSRFCFGGCETATAKPTPIENKPAPPVTIDRVKLETDYWRDIENSDDAENFRDYLEEVKKGTYPGNYAASARTKLRRLEAAKVNAANNKPPEVRPTPAAPVNVPAPTRTAEQTFYENARTETDYCAYLRQYPNGSFVSLARSRAGNCFIIPANPRKGEVVKNPQTNLELVWIPDGSFMMGSPASEKGRDSDEGPQRKVTFREGFWLGRTEVTQAQWQAIMGKLPDKCYSESASWAGEMTGGNKPVICISWNDAQDFIKRLNARQDGFTYSLPSEAQWEYAARGGTQTRFYWGDDLNYQEICRYANVADAMAKEKDSSFTWAISCRDNYFGLAPVASLTANSFGLYDMSGNVWEWVEDVYNASYQNLPTDGSANVSVGDSSSRLLRGGSWFSLPSIVRVSGRYRSSSANRNDYLGLRVSARASRS